MQLFYIDLPRDHTIFHLSCLHLGNIAAHEKAFDNVVDRIKSTKNAYAIFYGDMLDSIYVGDKRFDPRILKETKNTKYPTLDYQVEYLTQKLKPIKHKTLVILQGNHEWGAAYLYDSTNALCNNLKTRYGTFSCKITYTNNSNVMYKHWAMHGKKGINSSAETEDQKRVSMGKILKKQLVNKAGDCILMVKAHAHKIVVKKPERRLYLIDNGTEEKQRYTTPDMQLFKFGEFIPPEKRWYGCCGSFLKTRVVGSVTYSERAEYDPVELGHLISYCKNGKMNLLEEVWL